MSHSTRDNINRKCVYRLIDKSRQNCLNHAVSCFAKQQDYRRYTGHYNILKYKGYIIGLS